LGQIGSPGFWDFSLLAGSLNNYYKIVFYVNKIIMNYPFFVKTLFPLVVTRAEIAIGLVG